MMIQQMLLLLGLGVFLASCESGTGDKEKITPFSMNSLDSIIVGTDQGIYPVSGTCHEEGTVIAVQSLQLNLHRPPPAHQRPGLPRWT